jgi:hypothetical protein
MDLRGTPALSLAALREMNAQPAVVATSPGFHEDTSIAPSQHAGHGHGDSALGYPTAQVGGCGTWRVDGLTHCATCFASIGTEVCAVSLVCLLAP